MFHLGWEVYLEARGLTYIVEKPGGGGGYCQGWGFRACEVV
jgi:hypothetical protein